MTQLRRFWLPLMPAAVLALSLGCQSAKTPHRIGAQPPADDVATLPASGEAAPPTGTVAPAPAAIQVASAADVAKANELGLVPVLEYHGIGKEESRWVRRADRFRGDLEFLATNGYVTATTQDMLDGFPHVPAGKKPVVLTFDDARADQFVASGVDAKGLAIPTADCGVGIMRDVAKRYPGFGHRASFYLLPSFFEDDRTAAAKLKFLAANGFELGNHTWTHLLMSKATPGQIRSELVRLQAAVRKVVGPDFRTTTVALPMGGIPKRPDQQAAAMGGPGQDIHHGALLLVGANPATSPFAKGFNPARIARIQALDSEFAHWFKRKGQDTGRQTEAFTPYVADGDPALVSFPAAAADRLDPARLGKAKARKLGAKAVAALAETATNAPAAQLVASPSPEVEQLARVAAPTPSTTDATAVPAGTTETLVPEAASTSIASNVHPGFGKALPPGGTWQAGKISHKVQTGQSYEGLSMAYLPFTKAYTSRELRQRIAAANGLKRAWVKPGETLVIPDVLARRPDPKPLGWRVDIPIKGIYCTSTSAGMDRIFTLASALKKSGGNAVVFDIKDGPVSILAKDSKVRAMTQWDHTVTDLPKLVDRLHGMGIYVIARQVLFNDPVLAKRRPDLAIRSKATGKPWLEHGHLRWVDPSNPEVQDMNIRLAVELAQSGVDEIQFDYIRFPAQGNTRDCKYGFDEKVTPKHAIITAFLRKARAALAPLNARVGIDVYGVMAWGKDVDMAVTGQKIADMAKEVDVICPMVYPSHFYPPFDGFARPADQPYYFISQGVVRVRNRIGEGTVIRPWLQAFGYMVSNYNADYVYRQLQGGRDGKASGWLLWNASNKYDIAFQGTRHWEAAQQQVPVQVVHIKGETPGKGPAKGKRS
ncbi:MAG: polysaccharide deacetylase family protein [Candidatus Sericytochromatia bacterium]|nr:polysaccharide deacetylase family protein [Candidatus Tanganyikabacteria bacterium]